MNENSKQNKIQNALKQISKQSTHQCLLCLGTQIELWPIEINQFYQCQNCSLIFKDPSCFLNPTDEKNRYLLHQNLGSDKNYQKYLTQCLTPLLPFLQSHWLGLDFGSGPTRMVEEILKLQNLKCESYDPFFWPNEELFEHKEKYNFLTAIEVVEHFYQPAREFMQIVNLLKPKGYLFIVTGMPPSDFVHWWYHRDPTHVVFYSLETFNWLAQHYHLELNQISEHQFLFQKL